MFQQEDHDTYGRATTSLGLDDEVVGLNRINIDAEEVSLDIACQIEKHIWVEASSNQDLDDDDGVEEYKNLFDDNEDDYDFDMSDDD